VGEGFDFFPAKAARNWIADHLKLCVQTDAPTSALRRGPASGCRQLLSGPLAIFCPRAIKAAGRGAFSRRKSAGLGPAGGTTTLFWLFGFYRSDLGQVFAKGDLQIKRSAPR